MIIRSWSTRIRTALAIAAAPVLLAVGLVLTLMTVTPAVEAQSPPVTPASVSLTRADGTVTASWPAVSGATKYHVTYSTDGGGSWHAPVSNHTNITANRLTFGGDNAKTYIVGVRAGNDNDQWSGWRNSPSSGPYQPDPTPTPTATPTPTPAPNPPGPVASVTLTRADGTVTADWPAVNGATKYHATYTDDGGGSWHAPVNNHTNITTNSLTFNADNAKTYVVGVRAGNADGWSGWVNSPAAGPYTPQPTPTPPPTPTPTPTPDPAGIIVQDSNGNAITALAIPEGGEASYQVKLASQPEQDVEVCIGLSVRGNNDADITFKGEASDVVAIKLPFTSENWSAAQTVTLVAAEDDDNVNGARDLVIDAREYYSGKVELAATEVDNDEITVSAAPTGLTAAAGDQSVALAWNDPADSSITGYEYQVNHNDTATGNMSGWSSWQSIADSDADTTSYTVNGLTNGKEYRFKIRAVNAAGASNPGPQSSPWYVAATPVAPTPPTPPTSVTVTRSDGAITASWPAVSGATGYTVTYSAVGNGNWITAASNQTRTSITITGLNNDYTYLVGASASNAAGPKRIKRLAGGRPLLQQAAGCAAVGDHPAGRRGTDRLLELRLRRGELPRHLHRRQRQDLETGRAESSGEQRHHPNHHQEAGQRQALHRGRPRPQQERLQRLDQLLAQRPLRAHRRAAQAEER